MGDLRQALDNGEFRVEYQPQFLADGELVGFGSFAALGPS